MTKTYLGDGVYADIVQGMIVLTTENGVDVSNTIFLEPEVYAALQEWVQRITAKPEAPATGSAGILPAGSADTTLP